MPVLSHARPMRGAGPVLACLLQLSAAMIELVVLGGVLSGLLALCCPAWAWLRSQRFEAYLATRAKEVRDSALQPRDKPRPIRLRDLPAPVKLFFERCLRDSRTFSMWTARTIGELRFDGKSRWQPIEATTVAAVQEPAFSYTGTLKAHKLLWFRGRESYQSGHGEMEWRLWGAVAVAKQQGPQLDQSALVRYLGEAACFPPALLPSPHLKWLPSPTDPDRCARAVLSYDGKVVAATFTFDNLGRIKEIRSNDFYRAMKGGRLQRTPWFGRCGGYMRFGLGGEGIEVPTNLEVGWVEPDSSEFVYGKFTVASVRAQ